MNRRYHNPPLCPLTQREVERQVFWESRGTAPRLYAVQKRTHHMHIESPVLWLAGVSICLKPERSNHRHADLGCPKGSKTYYAGKMKEATF